MLFEFYTKSMKTYESCMLLYGLIHTENTVEEVETRESLYLQRLWDSVTGNAGDLHVQDRWAAVEPSQKMPLKNSITGITE